MSLKVGRESFPINHFQFFDDLFSSLNPSYIHNVLNIEVSGLALV